MPYLPSSPTLHPCPTTTSTYLLMANGRNSEDALNFVVICSWKLILTNTCGKHGKFKKGLLKRR